MFGVLSVGFKHLEEIALGLLSTRRSRLGPGSLASCSKQFVHDTFALSAAHFSVQSNEQVDKVEDKNGKEKERRTCEPNRVIGVS